MDLEPALVCFAIITLFFLWALVISQMWIVSSYFVLVVRKFIIPLPFSKVDLLSSFNVDIDGAFFGTTFAHMFLLQYPQYLASPSQVYEPTIFGYKIHESRYNDLLTLLNNSPYYSESKKKKKNEFTNSV